MRAIKPIKPLNKEVPDPFLLERIKVTADEIRRGEVYSLEEVFTEIQKLIEEKSKNATIPNNNKQNSQKRSA